MQANFGASYEYQLLHMDFQIGLGKAFMFWPMIPTHSTPSFIYCSYCWVIYVDAKGGGGGGGSKSEKYFLALGG